MFHAKFFNIVFAGALVALFALGGCVSAPEPTSFALTPFVQCSLPPASALPLMRREQLLSTKRDGKTHTVQTVLEVTSGRSAGGRGEVRVTLAGLSPLGARLFKAEYRGESAAGAEQRITVEQLAPLRGELPPAAQVLADIMLAYCPASAWAKTLPAGWRVEDRSPSMRVVLDPEGRVIEQIVYQLTVAETRAEPIGIRHSVFGYELKIQTAED